MLSAEVIGNSFPGRVLKTHIEKGRLAPTYLLTGQDRVLKKDLAVAFAASLNDRDAWFGDLESPAARRIIAGRHPDVHWAGADPSERSLKIEQVRNFIDQAGLRPFEGAWKVFVIEGAERLTQEAQNALLKVLEEPPGSTVFCLLAESKDHLLPTIQSRSFEIRMPVVCGVDAQEQRAAWPPGFGEKRWEDWFESCQGLSREKLSDLLSGMMEYFRHGLAASGGAPNAGLPVASALNLIDLLYETREALEGNVNQKLAMTRLAVYFKRILKNQNMMKGQA